MPLGMGRCAAGGGGRWRGGCLFQLSLEGFHLGFGFLAGLGFFLPLPFGFLTGLGFFLPLPFGFLTGLGFFLPLPFGFLSPAGVEIGG